MILSHHVNVFLLKLELCYHRRRVCELFVHFIAGSFLKLLKTLKSDGGVTMTPNDTTSSSTATNFSQMERELRELREENDFLNNRITLGGSTDEPLDESKAKVTLVRTKRDVVSVDVCVS